MSNEREHGQRYQERLESLVQERTAELAEANARLQMEISERKHVEEQLKKSLAEKEILLKEIHHRVKNNLQVVSSLLELQSSSVTDEQTRRLFRDSQDRIRAMALIHEKLHQKKDLVFIDFGEYVENLARYLFSSYVTDPGRIALRIEAENSPLGVDEAISCGLIINELVSNSLKYAFPGGVHGEVSVSFSINADGVALLNVADNGVGLPPGLDINATETLGLQVVATLARQLRSNLEIERDNGTSFALRFRAGSFKKSSCP